MTRPDFSYSGSVASPSRGAIAPREQLPVARGLGWRSVALQLGLAAATGVIAVVVAWFALGLTVDVMAMRWASGATGDQMLHYIVSASAVDHSLLTPNPRLGFPEYQNLFFAPMYDFASALVLTAGSLLIHDPIVLLNTYQLLGFFMTGFAGFLMFRALRLRNITATVFGTVFALAPFHFERVALGHAFVANYWGVAVLVVLVLIAGGRRTDPIAAWADAAPTRGWRITRRLVPILVMTLALSLTNSYYFVFAAIILACVIGIRVIVCLITREGLRDLLWPVVALGSLVVFVAIQLALLSLNFDDRYQKYFSERSPIESEQHSGKITTLLLPWPGSGIPGVGDRVREYAARTTVSPYAEPTGMSVLAIAGIVLLVIWALARLIVPLGGRRSRVLADPRLSILGLSFWVGLLFFTVGGLGFLFAALVTSEIRAWVRLSIVLATLGLAVLAVLIETTFTRRPSLWIALGLVVIVAFVDQIAGVREEVDLQPTADTEIRTLVAEADAKLEPQCGLAQLPVKSFPESGPIGGLGDYDLALPYVVGGPSTLRWSYGAVSGTRAGDFWSDVRSPSSFADAVDASGACGVYIDRRAYSDDSEWLAFVEAVYGDDWTFLGSETGAQVIVIPVR